MARKIGAKRIGAECDSVGRFRYSQRSTVTFQIFEFNICMPDGSSKTMRMSGESTISCPIQLIPINSRTDSIFAAVKLAEPLVIEPTMAPIDILVGTDYYYEFIGQEQIRCSNGLVLLSSPFGYVVGGSLTTANSYNKLESSLLIHQTSNTFRSMEPFWHLEDIGVKDNFTMNDDEVALQIFNETIEYHKGLYSVKWPWKATYPEFPDNYSLGLGRLKSLVRRLQSSPDLLKKYDQKIEDQMVKGIVEEAPFMPDGLVHYLPHHCVVTPFKATTKVRIVYDASATASMRSLSLNECIHRGPVCTADAVGIILRMRLHKFVVISDIEKAFLQVGLQTPDRDVTRFLWLKDSNKPLSDSNLLIYCFCRAPFGIASPFLLAATITHHIKSQTSNSKMTAAINDNVYVDNIFGTCDSETSANDFYVQAKSLFAAASMNLREWFSNCSELMQPIDPADKGKGNMASILGLQWNIDKDEIYVPTGSRSRSSDCTTKRQILRDIASVFYPCGLFSPVTINGKVLIQLLWKEKLEWDSFVPDQ